MCARVCVCVCVCVVVIRSGVQSAARRRKHDEKGGERERAHDEVARAQRSTRSVTSPRVPPPPRPSRWRPWLPSSQPGQWPCECLARVAPPQMDVPWAWPWALALGLTLVQPLSFPLLRTEELAASLARTGQTVAGNRWRTGLEVTVKGAGGERRREREEGYKYTESARVLVCRKKKRSTR
jgi:hypothetical protein